MIYQPTPLMKLCSKCGIVKRDTEFHRRKNTKIGISSCCRACDKARHKPNREKRNAQKRQWHEANREKQNIRRKQWSESHREETKAYHLKYYEANREKCLTDIKRHYKDNREQKLAYAKQYRNTNHEKVIADSREYYKTTREKQKEHSRRYYRTHCEAAREKYKVQHKHWRENNPEKVREGVHRRRARKRALPSTFTVAHWDRALEYFGGICAYCGNPPSLFDRYKVMHQEHHIPLVSGGGYTSDNIIPACQSCNLSKNDSDPAEWLKRKFGPRKAKQILDRINAYFEWVHEQDNHDGS